MSTDAKQDAQAKRDFDTLTAVLQHDGFDELPFDGGSPREIFEGWMARLTANNCTRPLSEKQRAWLEGVAARLDIATSAHNLVSSGVVKVKPKERESLQAFLGTLDRPKLPPHRMPRCSCCKTTRRNETDTWFDCDCTWSVMFNVRSSKCDKHGGKP